MKAAAGEAVQRAGVAAGTVGEGAVFAILGALSFCHLLNDMMQSLLPAIYPMLKGCSSSISPQIGLMTLTYQMHGLAVAADGRASTPIAARSPIRFRRAWASRWSGSCCCACADFGMLLVARRSSASAPRFSIPEASRVARLASGGQHGLAQSLFQVGGNFGSSLGPLLAAFIVLPRGQGSIAWFTLAALLGIVVLGGWATGTRYRHRARRGARRAPDRASLSRGQVALGNGDPDHADVLEILLPGEPHQLLHLLPDRPVPPAGARRRRSISSCSSPRSPPAPSSAARSATASAAST